ncbi:MAG: protein-L-isoaspartate O-methyltransferase [Alphaproteobacteria bacterium]|nr:protein-L-isoaspartate O-methyltransferase [Alphaproteobacteria bacterium]
MADYARARLNMVESQIRPNKVTDERLIDAFLALPREAFVDRTRHGIAYVDEDLPLGNGRFLTAPMVLGRLIQTLAVRPSDVVLDVGCATGYSTAVLSRLAATVVGLESDAGLVEAANQTLSRLGADNAGVVRGPLVRSLPAQGPYDVILVQGSVPAVPAALLDQLAEGGRLAAVVREEAGPGRATLMIKIGGVVSRRVVFDANTRPLPGIVREERFAF